MVRERKKKYLRTEMVDEPSLIHLLCPSNPCLSVGAALTSAETSSTFQKPSQLWADEGQFSLFKNKAISDTTGL